MATATKARAGTVETLIVPRPQMTEVRIRIKGTAPYVQNKFSEKAKLKMMADMQTKKSQSKTKNDREPRDYDREFIAAQHVSTEGWNGIPAPALRAAMIDACRTAGIVMTRAKLAVFVLQDGIDKDDGTPLVRLFSESEPERNDLPVRNASGVTDIRIRPMWRDWEAVVRIVFDQNMIDRQSVINLLTRAGLQVGIGEGRHNSKNSYGQGWGTFTIVEGETES